MIIPPRIAPSRRRSGQRARTQQLDWPSVVAGAGAFLILAGGCLYLVTHLAP